MIKKHTSLYRDSTILSPHGFGTKLLGDGRDESLLKQLFPTHHIIIPSQTHSTHIEAINASDVSDQLTRIASCDGLITQDNNIVLTVVTADCVPLLYEDPILGVIGISHQGWKGTVQNLAGAMVMKMITMGSKVENIRCSMGPAINSCCYQMMGERLVLFQKRFGSYESLYKSNYQSLTQVGVPSQHISIFPFCTSCDRDNFYSYRRDNAILGEMLSYIYLSK